MAKKQKNIKQVKNSEEMDLFEEIPKILKHIPRSYVYTAMVIVIIIALLALGFYYAKTSNNFTYNGVTFNKTYLGKIVFYTAQVPVIDSYNRVVAYNPMDFRSDPREIGNIPLYTSGSIRFSSNKTTFISYQSDIKVCEDNMLAAVNLHSFLKDFGLNPIGALDNETLAREQNLAYATCQKYPNNTVIYIRQAIGSEETGIIQTAGNCYEIVSYDCDILKVIERFQLKMLEEYLAGFRKV